MSNLPYYEENNMGKHQKQCFKQKQSEAQLLELTYGHLGRLVQSAEMLAHKLNIISKDNLKYQIYDSFEIAYKKNIDTLRYDVINFLDFYEKAISIHNQKYTYVNPSSIGIVINDLIIWEKKSSNNDKRFFQAILDLIQNGKYDISLFPDEDELYKKAKKDNTKFKKSPGFWKNFAIPILNFLNNLLNDVQKNVEENPEFKPDIHFGKKPTKNTNLLQTYEYAQKEREINSKLNEINLILQQLQIGQEKPENLVKASEELHFLYKDFKNIYGDSINLDENAIKLMKISLSKLDKNLCKKLNEFCIDIDPDK